MKFVNIWWCNECDAEVDSIDKHAELYPRHTYTQRIRPKGRKSFSKEYDMVISESTLFTTSTDFVDALKVPKGSKVQRGTYKVNWYCEYYQVSPNARSVIIIYDGELERMRVESPGNVGRWMPASGFFTVDLDGYDKNISIKYKTTNSNYSAGIRNARLEFWRLS
jgi:hypothetical protein